jgi:gas vesicle protein
VALREGSDMKRFFYNAGVAAAIGAVVAVLGAPAKWG